MGWIRINWFRTMGLRQSLYIIFKPNSLKYKREFDKENGEGPLQSGWVIKINDD